MGKLKSPSCLLAGTPLSADEMKQITGGMNSYKVCICTFYSEKRVARTEELKVDTEASCSAGCKKIYSDNYMNYDDYDWDYGAGS